MMYIGIAFLYLAVVPSSIGDDNIHKFMSDEEIQQMFHWDRDSVPMYEFVPIEVSERLQKRDLPEGSHIQMRACGENINLWLHPTDSVLAGVDTPVYYARHSPSNPEGVEFLRRDGIMARVGRIFEDPKTSASLVIGTDEKGKIRVNGHIGSSNMMVRSLPPRVAEEYRRRRRSSGDFQISDSYHLVFKSNKMEEVGYSLLPVNETKLRQRLPRSTIPPTLYLEVLVVVENCIFKKEEHDHYGFLEYILAFWNGVDLKYRSLENPSVRFHIAGIVLSIDAGATPFISNNMLDSDAFNSTQAMLDIRTFFYGIKNSIALESYDIAVTMTRLKFGLGQDGGIQGLARVGYACRRSDYTKTMDGVALIQDRGEFLSIHTAAHEVGHLLGAHHDPNTERWYFTDGFIMASMMVSTSNTSDFSKCSMEGFQTTLGFDQLSCLYNRPKENSKKLPHLMPGRMFSLEEQCKAAYMQTSCLPETQTISLCLKLYCLDENGKCVQTVRPALDGTPCEGHNKVCGTLGSVCTPNASVYEAPRIYDELLWMYNKC